MRTHLYKVGDKIITNEKIGRYGKNTKCIVEKLIWSGGIPNYQTSIPIGSVNEDQIRLRVLFSELM